MKAIKLQKLQSSDINLWIPLTGSDTFFWSSICEKHVTCHMCVIILWRNSWCSVTRSEAFGGKQLCYLMRRDLEVPNQSARCWAKNLAVYRRLNVTSHTSFSVWMVARVPVGDFKQWIKDTDLCIPQTSFYWNFLREMSHYNNYLLILLFGYSLIGKRLVVQLAQSKNLFGNKKSK